MEFFITMVIAYSLLLLMNYVLKLKIKRLVVLYVSIWNRPYPSKKTIDKFTVTLCIIVYMLILIFSIIKKY